MTKSDFHRLFDSGFAPSALSLRLNHTFKLGGRLSSEVEHWDVNPKVRGSIPRVSRIYRVKRMIDIINC